MTTKYMYITTDKEVDEIRHAARMMVRELGLLADAYQNIGVTLAMRHLLLELSVECTLTISDVADRLLLDKSTASRLVTKSVRKGFVSYAVDQNDKRKRTLQLTVKGQTTLDAFEPLARQQVRDALATLDANEAHSVKIGLQHFMEGLYKARRLRETSRNGSFLQESMSIGPLREICEQLSSRGYVLELCRDEDKDGLYEIFAEVVDAGIYFPYEASTRDEFQRRFFEPDTRVYVCKSASRVIGGFYLKTNYPGRCSHIANAAYLISKDHRGKGLGKLLTKASLILAKELGYKAMQYNMVLSENERAITLYEQLGFEIIGTIPHAVRKPDGGYQTGFIMSRSL